MPQWVSNRYVKRKPVKPGGSLAVPGVRIFQGGKATKRFNRLASGLLEKRASLYRKLAEGNPEIKE